MLVYRIILSLLYVAFAPLRWWLHRPARRHQILIDGFIRDWRAKCDAPALSFAVGDRVKAVNHRIVNDSGGYGTIVDVDYWHGLAQRRVLRVQFDDFPQGRPTCMAPSELVYARE